MMSSLQYITEFKRIIWQYYAEHGRTFDWRHTDDPYKVFISEVMLQQTQTQRVALKYPQFLDRFPTFERLAHARLHDVLLAWQGLGYNRRGKFLYESAKIIMQNFDGRLPRDSFILEQLPGIGPATARSIVTFAYNEPTIFIETNIRAVFIYFFFSGKEKISDKELMPYLSESLNKERARDWYYALMDYGVMLKKTIVNPSRKSAHHAVQSKFEGSDRQIRGMILRILTQSAYALPVQEIFDQISRDKEKIIKILQQMNAEGLIAEDANGKITIA